MKSVFRIRLPAPAADIYRAVAKLEELYPGRKFTPGRHLVGQAMSSACSPTVCA
jgi:hypothetical protein